MRKGLVSFIIILCMLIPLAVGCQNNTAAPTLSSIAGEGTTAPDKMDAQTTVPLPAFTEPGTEDGKTTEPQEAESSTPTVTPDPTAPQTTEPVIQETEPDTTDAPTESPQETDPPATEEPKQTEPKPAQPKPTEPTPTTPVPTEPKPTDPPVTEPPATEPPATEPAEVIDLNALVQYGRNYAANTYGYEVSPGLRDGYYPAYTCVISTMEEGRAAVRGCIDDTTRALLAVPGTQIVVEIDGVLCRARIDIAIVPKDEGTYLVSVYYG